MASRLRGLPRLLLRLLLVVLLLLPSPLLCYERRTCRQRICRASAMPREWWARSEGRESLALTLGILPARRQEEVLDLVDLLRLRG